METQRTDGGIAEDEGERGKQRREREHRHRRARTKRIVTNSESTAQKRADGVEWKLQFVMNGGIC